MSQDHESSNSPGDPRPDNQGLRLTAGQNEPQGTFPPQPKGEPKKAERILAIALGFGAAAFLLSAAGALFYFAFLSKGENASLQADPQPPAEEHLFSADAAAPATPKETVIVEIPATTPEENTPPAPPGESVTVEIPGATGEDAPPAPPETPPLPPQPSAELQAFVDSMTITGVRTSPDGNRVIINGRVHAIGDRISPSRELQLLEIAPRQLILRDRHGFTYERNL